ncbi:MAG TPA: co-chaperone GroES [Candidatus Moranbacteria bacterium]|nr:co-chaperone GroES [Candidatus Moranbacteria bacterium]
MPKTSVRPLGDNVLVEPAKTHKQTEHGIYLPETSSKEKPQEGKVLAIGESKDIKVKKGEAVIFRKYSGTEIKVDGTEYLLVKNEDILAVVE